MVPGLDGLGFKQCAWKNLPEPEFTWPKEQLLDQISAMRHDWKNKEYATDAAIEKSLDKFESMMMEHSA